jgi:hypothetical protein
MRPDTIRLAPREHRVVLDFIPETVAHELVNVRVEGCFLCGCPGAALV